MNASHWNRQASSYTDDVLNTLASDRRGVIRNWLDRLANPRHVAADFGCGIGHYLGALAQRFKYVYGFDHSAECLAKARETHGHLPNVSVHLADLAQPVTRTRQSNALDAALHAHGDGAMQPIRFAVCMNVLIAPDHALRSAILNTIVTVVHPGAHVLLIVPALESALYTDVRVVEWNMREGMTHKRAITTGLHDEPGTVGRPAAGIVTTGGVATKHYLREEAELFFRSANLKIVAVDKVEYPWDTEFERPPRWLGDPYPWDWLFVCRAK